MIVPGTSISTPDVCDCGANETAHSPAPSPESETVSSNDLRCAPGDTSMRWNDSDCGSVKIFGSSAASAFARPAPSSSTGASCVRAVFPHALPAVDISADFTWYGVHVCRCNSSAAAPAMWGAALAVPANPEHRDPRAAGGPDQRP